MSKSKLPHASLHPLQLKNRSILTYLPFTRAFNLAPPSSPTNALPQPLPSPLAPHAPLLTTFQTSCQTLCQTLLSHLSAALATPPDWFTSRHDAARGPTGSIFRMLYYPALSPEETQKASEEGEELDLRAGAHSDFGSLTLLFRLPGQPGLEIRTAEGKWEGVGFGESAGEEGGLLPILVNIGDLLEDVRIHPSAPPSPLTVLC